MPDLSFTIEGAELVPYAVAPMVAFKLHVRNSDPAEQISSVILQCQVQIEAPRRRYAPEEQSGLVDLFGSPERWGQTLRSMLWTHAQVNVPPFSGEITVDLPVACTFDFNVASTKYFKGLDAGEVPLCFLFSGTVFYENSAQGLQVAQISWNKEARFRWPVSAWRQLIDLYYPNTAWLTLRRDVFERLEEYKQQNGAATWEQALERLLAEAAERILT